MNGFRIKHYLTTKTIRTNLILWFLLMSLLPLVVGMTITYTQQKRAMEQEAVNKLVAIRDLKVQQVNAWISERFGDLNSLAHDNELSILEDNLSSIAAAENSTDNRNIHRILNRYLDDYIAFEEIFIINPTNGIIEISTNEETEGSEKSAYPYFTIPLNNREKYISDVYLSTITGNNTMVFSIPIFCTQHIPNHIIGILAMRMNLHETLYSLLLNKIGLGETGETLIVNEDVVALNELRWYEDAPLNLTIEAEPAVEAANGNTGVTKTQDYRGVEVLAAYTYIPETGWGFIAKQDLSELNAPISNLVRNFLFLFFVSLIIIFLIVYMISKRISDPIVLMSRNAQKIKSGDLLVRNDITTGNELELLADSINSMADSIELRIASQRSIVSITDSMVDHSSPQIFSHNLLKELIAATNANMGTFYSLNEQQNEFEPLVSIGVDVKVLKPFSAEFPEGEFWQVVEGKEIVYFRDIPEDTVFTYKTVVGNLLPKEILTIPVVVDSVVVALISLITIDHFGENCQESLKQSWVTINSSYASLMANEKTKAFAERMSLLNQQLEAQSEEMQEQSEELQNQAEELRYNADELQEQNIELERQKKQGEESNRLKSEFLSNMSHELRTPLNSIMALSRVLIMQTEDKLTEDETKYLHIVEKNGKNLLSLINDILDLSKVEAGKIELHPTNCSIHAVLTNICDSISPLAKDKGLAFRLNFAEGLPMVETDESKLHQVIQNVISNAVKFTETGFVDISVSYTTGKLSIVVKDTGIGISQHALPHIFDEFRQADGSSSRKYEGTGLGLAIAYKLIKNLNGDIQVESEIGEGSQFTITLPFKWQGNMDSTEILSYNKYAYAPEPEQKMILVIDDDPEYLKEISENLVEAGYKTLQAESGQEALKLAEKHQLFAIISDILMPEIDGLELLQVLKSKKETKDIPVIMVSVSNSKETAFALGAVGYIQKPVNKQQLVTEIYKLHANPDSVMIVDNDEFDRKQLADIIHTKNIHTVTAESGKECLRLLQEYIPDILVLDLLMPEMNGFEVLESVRSSAELKNLPVIIVTAKDLTSQEQKLINDNASSILTKNETIPKDLLQEIKRILSEQHMPKQVNSTIRMGARPRILIVEDNEVTVIQIRKVLEKEHYIVDIAPGGKQALEYMQDNIPDGIILDLMMPEIDGFAVLESIRSTEDTKKIPVLILTAKDLTKKDLSKLSSNNIQQLIQKGDIDIDGLLFKVHLMLGNEPKFSGVSTVPADKKIVKKPLSNTLKKIPASGVNTDLPQVLIVEDNIDNMITIKALLGTSYTILEASDGEGGLACAIKELPDLILLDVSLPEMDGLEVVSRLKRDETTQAIPVIAVTAHAMLEDREKFLSSGFDDYMTKPIDHEILHSMLEKWVTHRKENA